MVGEIVPSQDFYDYADKYLLDSAGLIAPAELPKDVTERLRELAVQAFAALGGAGLARVDFLYEGGVEGLYVNEINTLPGFTSISMYPRLWELSGVPLPQHGGPPGEDRPRTPPGPPAAGRGNQIVSGPAGVKLPLRSRALG